MRAGERCTARQLAPRPRVGRAPPVHGVGHQIKAAPPPGARPHSAYVVGSCFNHSTREEAAPARATQGRGVGPAAARPLSHPARAAVSPLGQVALVPSNPVFKRDLYVCALWVVSGRLNESYSWPAGGLPLDPDGTYRRCRTRREMTLKRHSAAAGPMFRRHVSVRYGFSGEPGSPGAPGGGAGGDHFSPLFSPSSPPPRKWLLAPDSPSGPHAEARQRACLLWWSH